MHCLDINVKFDMERKDSEHQFQTIFTATDAIQTINRTFNTKYICSDLDEGSKLLDIYSLFYKDFYGKFLLDDAFFYEVFYSKSVYFHSSLYQRIFFTKAKRLSYLFKHAGIEDFSMRDIDQNGHLLEKRRTLRNVMALVKFKQFCDESRSKLHYICDHADFENDRVEDDSHRPLNDTTNIMNNVTPFHPDKYPFLNDEETILSHLEAHSRKMKKLMYQRTNELEANKKLVDEIEILMSRCQISPFKPYTFNHSGCKPCDYLNRSSTMLDDIRRRIKDIKSILNNVKSSNRFKSILVDIKKKEVDTLSDLLDNLLTDQKALENEHCC